MTEAAQSQRLDGGGQPRWTLTIEFPWAVYVAVLAVLSVAERLATPEGAGLDRIIDAALNWAAFLGLIGASIRCAASARNYYGRLGRGVRIARVVGSSFLGPLLATVATTTLAHDVDGANWMLFSPFLGIACVTFASVLMPKQARHP